MVRYRVGEDTYTLPEDRVEEFLEKYPNAILITEDESVEKTLPSPEESVTVEENVTLDNTDLEPVSTSSALPLRYKVGEDTYTLPDESRVAELLNKYPDAEPYEGKESIQELQKTQPNGEAVDGFWDSMYVSFMNSLDNIELQRQSAALIGDVEDGKLEAENAANYVVAMQNVNDNQQIQSIKDYDASVKKYEAQGDNGMVATLKGLYDNPEAGFAMAINSLGTVYGSIAVGENVKEGLKYAGAGAATGAVASSIAGTVGGPLGTLLGTIGGTIGGGLRGFYFGAMKQLETQLLFSELLNERIEGEITAQKITDIFEDKEFVDDILNKAENRGIGVAAVETMLAFLPVKAGGVMSQAIKGTSGTVGRAVTSTAARMATIGVVEAGVGMLGEATGQLASGQELDLREITEEGIISPYGKAITLAEYTSNVRTLQDEVKISSTLKPTKYKNVSELFADESSSETQVNISKLKRSQKILDLQVDAQVNKNEITKEEGDNIKRNFRDTQGAVNRIKPLNFNTEQETKAVELLKEKQQLINEIKEVDEKALTQPQQERVDAIDKELNDLRVERATETITEAVDPSRVILVENDQELQDKYDIKGANYSAAGGFFKDGKFYINKEVAGQFETITEPSHELLHPILKEVLKANPQELVDEFKKVIGEDNVRAVQKRIDGIEVYTDEYMQTNPDEFITQFGDMILEGEITYNDNIFTKIGDYITPLLRKFGFKKIKFDSGRDVYNFMREYSKGIERGKLSEDVKAVIPTELQSEETFSVKDKTSVLEAINNLVPQDITTQEEYQSFIRDERSSFPKLYRAITQQGGVINNYIRKISTSPEEVQKTVERLVERTLKFNPEAKRKGTKKAVGIEAFGERIFADIQYARKGSKLELYEESEKTKRESRREDREDGFETLAAPETEIETTPAPPARGRKLVKKQALSEENQKALEKVIAEADFTEEQLTFKTLPNAAIEIFAKEIGIPAKKFAGSSNFTQDELSKVITYIEENIDIIRQALPQAAVLEGAPVSESLIGTATGVPNNLLKDPNLYTRKERTTKKAGIVPYEKNKGIDNSSILKAIGIIDGKRTAGPRDKQAQTAKGLINVLAKFATNQEVRLQKNLTPQQQTNIETGKGSQVLFSAKDKNKFNKIFKNAPEEVLKYGMLLNVKPTQKAINKVLDKIQEDLAPDAYEEYYKKYFEPYIQFRKFAQKQKWPWAEEKVRDTLAFLSKNNPNLRLKNIKLNTDSQQVDIQFELDGEKVLVEVKKNYEARISQIYLYEETNGKISTNKTAEKIYEDKIIEADKNRDVLIDRIYRDYEKYPIKKTTVNGRVQYIVPIFAINGARESLKKDKIAYETTIKMPIGLAVSLYNTKANKTKNVKGLLISFGDLGTFYIGENKMQFPVAPLEQKGVELTVRIMDKYNPRKAPVMFEGKPIAVASLSRVAVNTLTKKAVEVLENTPSLSLQNESQAAAILNTAYSIKQATAKNNNKLPASQKLPKGSTNEQVLAKMRELDNQANEERTAFSAKQNLDEAFNDIIEAKTGIETYKRFSPAKAEVRGASKGKFNFFIPPSAEDFTGLLYKTLAKGKVGDRQMQWYKDNLLDPYARAMNDISSARVALFEDYKTLKKDLKIIPKDLKKKGFDEYTNEQAVRVYIWDKQGDNIPGLYKTDRKELVDYINNKPELKLFADQLIAIQKGDQYSKPKEGWLAGTITTDLLDGVNSIKRKKYLEQWQTNADEIFSEVNMNKLEAAFGKPYRKALENILTRMKTGRNKPFTSDSLAGRVTDWLNNSVGAIMFFNTRSAVLQTISSINFINWSDNNIYKAGKAFANQPQYWKDFKFLFNSDFLKERRGGLRFNVSESEIADAAKKGGVRGVISKILQAGFLPTQMADSFAIATGGATFYRNRVDAYVKQGMDAKEAQDKAFQDFREIAEESQQSSRPDRISAQQAGPLGRTILAFANTPAQYARLTKKAASDLINGRGDAKTNISKLLYYGAVQNLIFNALQQALFAIAFGDEEDEEKKDEKYLNVANGMADGLLRGIGLQGAIISTLKNTLLRIIKESEKSRPDYAETAVMQLFGISPPIQSKAQKIRSAMKSYEWNKKEMLEKGFSLDNPAYLAGANVISASTNVPLDRVIKKVDNVRSSTREDLDVWQRMMLLAGWSDWQLGIQKTKTKTKSRKRKSGRSGPWKKR